MRKYPVDKKIKAGFTAVGLTAALLLSACSGNGKTAQTEASQSDTAAETSAAGTESSASDDGKGNAESKENGEASGKADKNNGETKTSGIPADAHVIKLTSSEGKEGSYTHTAEADGKEVQEYDYTWNVDLGSVHDEVKNSPAEYFTGTEPGDDSIYIAHDIYYYPEIDTSLYSIVNYDGDQEWAVYYQDDEYKDYIFATLPVSGKEIPTDMMHSAEEAYENAVLHITEAGTYAIEGEWHGQILIDLGDDAAEDPEAKVTVYLNGADVTCTVAPSIIFKNVYECCGDWEDEETHTASVDTAEAGANVVIVDGSENNFTGTNVFRMFKTKYKDDDEQPEYGVKLQKKARKTDGAFYSYMSMNIDGQAEGSGILNINSGYEGLDSELHLTFNGGIVNIYSQDDSINVNEDGVSTVTVNGGLLHIVSGLGNEGDGIDSNGFLVINGGTVIAAANPRSDSGLDSDCGTYVNGGTVISFGSTMDWAEADDENASNTEQVTMNMAFNGYKEAGTALIITDTDGKVVFAYDPSEDEALGEYARSFSGVIISSPELKLGQDYNVYAGGKITGTEVSGMYDVKTVTAFSEDAVMQAYTGTSIMHMGPAGFGGGHGGPGMGGRGMEGQDANGLAGRPEMNGMPMDGNMPSGDAAGVGTAPDGGAANAADGIDNAGPAHGHGPQGEGRPEGMDNAEMPSMPDEFKDGEMPSMPADFNGEMPSMPADFNGEMPEGMSEGGFPGGPGMGGFGMQEDEDAEQHEVFSMTEQVNDFTGVRDFEKA